MDKVRMLRSFDPAVSGHDLLDQGIEDPWYGGHRDFDAAWHQIHGAVPGIVEHVRAVLRRGTQQQRQQQVRSTS